MDEQRIKAFEFASDLTKQVITLSSGIIAFMVTFNKDIVKIGVTPKISVWLLSISLILYLFSVLFGILTLMALTGQLEPLKDEVVVSPPISQYPTTGSSIIRIGSAVQLVTFFLATLLVLIFGLSIIWGK